VELSTIFAVPALGQVFLFLSGNIKLLCRKAGNPSENMKIFWLMKFVYIVTTVRVMMKKTSPTEYSPKMNGLRACLSVTILGGAHSIDSRAWLQYFRLNWPPAVTIHRQVIHLPDPRVEAFSFMSGQL